MTDSGIETAMAVAWSLACLASVCAVIGLLFHNQLIRWGRRLRAALAFPARHRVKSEESPMAAAPQPVIHPHDDLSAPVRAMLARTQQPAADGRGRRWDSSALHGDTQLLPLVADADTALVGA